MVDFTEVERELVPLASAGHPIGRCNACGAPVLIAVKNTPACRLTPGCKGKHVAAGQVVKGKPYNG